MNNGLIKSITENAAYVAGFLVIVAAAFGLAYLFERLARKKRGDQGKILTTRVMIVTGIFAAISVVLMMIEMPVPFAPPFYKIDLSDLPALVGAFAFGPMTGVLIEFIKILLELVLRGTTTAFVGELANFVVGCSFVMTASIVYNFKKSKGMAVLSCIAGTAMITVVGTLLNAVYLLPAFAKLYGMPLDALIAMGTQVNSSVTDIFSFVVLCVAPLNLLKGGIDSVITVLVYKSLSPILKNSHVESIRKTDTAENNI